MTRNRLLLECSACGQGKLIDVAVSDDGLIGVVKRDECKTKDLRAAHASRRPARRPTVEATVSDGRGSSDLPMGRLRQVLGNVFSPAH
jgi:hypothetical protein